MRDCSVDRDDQIEVDYKGCSVGEIPPRGGKVVQRQAGGADLVCLRSFLQAEEAAIGSLDDDCQLLQFYAAAGVDGGQFGVLQARLAGPGQTDAAAGEACQLRLPMAGLCRVGRQVGGSADGGEIGNA